MNPLRTTTGRLAGGFLTIVATLLLTPSVNAAGVSSPRLSPRPGAVAGVSETSVDLAGTWRFNATADIQVPGGWVMQGFAVEPGKAAHYERTFSVPKDWGGQRIKLRCDAVFSDATVWINDQEAGKHLASMQTMLTTAMLIATMTATGHGQTAAAAAKGTFEQFWADAQKEKRADKSKASQKRMAWWRDARFGMFMCWTPCSVAACEIGFARESFDGGLGGIGISTGTNPRAELHKGSELDGFVDWMTPSVPKAVYDSLYKSFYPGMFDADKLVGQAKQAGMKYIVQIAEHCDGFCMWDTKFYDYNIMATPFKRDIIGEMAKASKKAGLKYGIYYCQRDWWHPDYTKERLPKYNEYMRNQIKELLARYPEISIIWFDAWGWSKETWETGKMFKMIHAIRPDIIIDERAGVPADFSCPEETCGITMKRPDDFKHT